MYQNELVVWHISQAIVFIGGSLAGIYYFFVRPDKFKLAVSASPLWKRRLVRVALYLALLGILIGAVVVNWNKPLQ